MAFLDDTGVVTLVSHIKAKVDALVATKADASDIPVLATKQLRVVLTVAGNGEGHTNLKTLIDGDLPSGATCLGVVGFTTNDQNLLPMSVRYVDDNYSLQVRNLSSSAATNKAMHILYLYMT